jgi:hypothetical protein
LKIRKKKNETFTLRFRERRAVIAVAIIPEQAAKIRYIIRFTLGVELEHILSLKAPSIRNENMGLVFLGALKIETHPQKSSSE